ncbi:MAG TPA: ArdC-like ssDNA-binding domain-containing protein, partial [bacterium]
METEVKEKSKVQELLQVVRDGIAKIQSSTEWKEWLDASAKFWKYSFHNQMLIRWQKPGATRIAGYRTWLQFGRHVRKGETGIKIIAPYTIKVPIKDVEEEKLVPVLTGFRVVSVFDISQTEGKEVPNIYHPLRGTSTGNLVDTLTRFITGKGYSVRVGTTPSEDIYGYVNDKKEIVLKEGESSDHQALVLAHEMSHALLGHVGSFQNQAEKELEAETSAWIICRNLGLRTDETSFAYLATWANGPERDKKLEGAASRACQVAEVILEGLETM